MGWGEPSGVAPARRLELVVLARGEALADRVSEYLGFPSMRNRESMVTALTSYREARSEHEAYFR